MRGRGGDTYCKMILGGALLFSPQRDLLPKEKNLETVLTLAFLEIDKAFARHAHVSADGK